jgi:SpoVK/Ycf46/Vps4 family AAA+-type ATPase
MLAGVAGDTSGVSQEQHGELLSYMQDNDVDGVIYVGPAGGGKSAMAKSAGNFGGVPTIAMNFGAMKAGIVGESGRKFRTALKVCKAISQGRMLFIATSNNIGSISPELKRRFCLGTFFFDLPKKETRKDIWELYAQKFGLTAEQFDTSKVADDDWTGAEIRTCCKLAARFGTSIGDASGYIVPVARVASDRIEQLRREANGTYINAAAEGFYTMDSAPVGRAKRALGEYDA